jgi:hypothetical protein
MSKKSGWKALHLFVSVLTRCEKLDQLVLRIGSLGNLTANSSSLSTVVREENASKPIDYMGNKVLVTPLYYFHRYSGCWN